MKSLFKNFYRSLRGSFMRFMSIFLISFLGVGFFAGVNTVQPVMIDSAQSYFEAQRLSDLTIYTPLDLTEKECLDLRTRPDVEQLDVSRIEDVYIDEEQNSVAARFFMLPGNRQTSLNQLYVTEGRYPTKPREILMDALMEQKSPGRYYIGQKLKIIEPDVETMGRALAYETFEIVGFAYSPLYLTYERDTTLLGAGSIETNIYAHPQAFLGEKNNYLLFKMRDMDGLHFNSDEYEELSSDYVDELDPLGEALYLDKTKELRDRYEKGKELLQEEKDAGYAKLDQANDEIESSKKQLREAQAELDAGVEEAKQKLADGQAEIEENKKKLEEGEEKQRQGELQMAQAEQQYMLGGMDLALGRSQLNQSWQTLELSRSALDRVADLIDDNRTKHAQLVLDLQWMDSVIAGLPAPVDQAYLSELASVVRLYAPLTAQQIEGLNPDSALTPQLLLSLANSARGIMAAQEVEWAYAAEKLMPLYEQSLQDYNAGKAAYDAGLAEYTQGATEYQIAGEKIMKGRAELRQGTRDLLNGRLAIRDGEDELQRGKEDLESETAKNQAEIDAGWAEIDNAQGKLVTERQNAEKMIRQSELELEGVEKQINALPTSWFVYRRADSPGFAGYAQDAARMGAVGRVFPLFFFLVASLVCLTTMTRMIEEERQHMGLLRSLGYGVTATSIKYVAYALSATVLGSIAGGYFGLWAFPTVITWAYQIVYAIPEFQLQFQSPFLTISILLQMTLTLIVTGVALAQNLNEQSAQLLLPKAPKPGKRILLERVKPVWNLLSFSQKLTTRNIFRFKVRSSMTILGIAGCTALLLAGLGIGNSVRDILNIQADELWHYDMMIAYSDAADSQAEHAMQTIVDESPLNIEKMELFGSTAHVRLPDGKLTSATWQTFDANAHQEKPFVTLRDRVTHERIDLTDQGIVLTEKLASAAGVGVGDTMTWKDIDGREYEAPVDAICENYVGHYLVMSPQAYENICYDPLRYNVWLLRARDDGNGASSELDLTEEFDALEHDFLEEPDVLMIKKMSSMVADIEQMLQPISMVVLVIVISAALLAFVVLYNLTSININERVREIATIKVLGFYPMEVSNYIFSEVFFLSFLGCIVGLFLGVVLHHYIILTVELDNVMFGRMIHTMSYVYSAILTTLFTLLVALFMHFRLQKIDMVDSLKSLD